MNSYADPHRRGLHHARLVGGTDGLVIANMNQIQFGKATSALLGAALAVSSMIESALT